MHNTNAHIKNKAKDFLTLFMFKVIFFFGEVAGGGFKLSSFIIFPTVVLLINVDVA